MLCFSAETQSNNTAEETDIDQDSEETSKEDQAVEDEDNVQETEEAKTVEDAGNVEDIGETSEEDKELLMAYHHSFDDERVDLDLVVALLTYICDNSQEGMMGLGWGFG